MSESSATPARRLAMLSHARPQPQGAARPAQGPHTASPGGRSRCRSNRRLIYYADQGRYASRLVGTRSLCKSTVQHPLPLAGAAAIPSPGGLDRPTARPRINSLHLEAAADGGARHHRFVPPAQRKLGEIHLVPGVPPCPPQYGEVGDRQSAKNSSRRQRLVHHRIRSPGFLRKARVRSDGRLRSRSSRSDGPASARASHLEHQPSPAPGCAPRGRAARTCRSSRPGR